MMTRSFGISLVYPGSMALMRMMLERPLLPKEVSYLRPGFFCASPRTALCIISIFKVTSDIIRCHPTKSHNFRETISSSIGHSSAICSYALCSKTGLVVWIGA